MLVNLLSVGGPCQDLLTISDVDPEPDLLLSGSPHSHLQLVVSGILKDFLRELPSPLITTRLYHVVREAMTRYPPPVTPDPQLAQSTVGLLSCLPSPERVTEPFEC